MDTSAPNTRKLFARSLDDRVVTGVAAGIGQALGVAPLLVRGGFVLLSFASGIGIGFYVLAFASSSRPEQPANERPVTERRTIGFLCVVLGLLMFFHGLNLVLAPAVLIPLMFVAGAVALVWMRSAEEENVYFSHDPVRAVLAGRHALWRLAAGVLLLAIGTTVFVSQSTNFASASGALAAVSAISIGVVLLTGPWLVRLYRQLIEERRSRIRSEERAEMSAHLHDSVLQTLSLIQRADVSTEVATLARRQERELRAWMQGKAATAGHTLTSALDEMVERVEHQHAIAVESVIVGDTPTSEETSALLLAIQEAVVNAARHSGAPSVSVYVEVEPAQVLAYVRDSGRGFDNATIPADRRGLSESIEGRMRRAGGRARISSKPGEGTEIELEMPVFRQ